ncbi:uncharacterized protein Dsimw501_GD28698 [Drosophila simulans]|nr:uncharacterized protein Dsimw501_GD28698 [Drosophila simulans]
MTLLLCRVCMTRFENKSLRNLFEVVLEQGVSIASVIAECTGFEVKKGDRFSEYVCTVCLEDAKNAFEIKETYGQSHNFYSWLKSNSQKKNQRGTKKKRLKVCDDIGNIRKVENEMGDGEDLSVDTEIKDKTTKKQSLTLRSNLKKYLNQFRIIRIFIPVNRVAKLSKPYDCICLLI